MVLDNRFGKIAIEKGLITEDELYEALYIQQKEKEGTQPVRFIGKILEDLGYITDKQIEEILSIGDLIPLYKKERILCKEILSHSLKSDAGRRYIIERFGLEYIEIAQNLLKKLGNKQNI